MLIKNWFAPAILVLGVVAFLLVTARDERTRLTLFDAQGSAESGKRLGVTIGASPAEARRQLESRGLSFYETARGGTCVFRSFPQNKRLDVFADNSWRRGTVCVVSENDAVEGIVWYFNPFAP